MGGWLISSFYIFFFHPHLQDCAVIYINELRRDIDEFILNMREECVLRILQIFSYYVHKK